MQGCVILCFRPTWCYQWCLYISIIKVVNPPFLIWCLLSILTPFSSYSIIYHWGLVTMIVWHDSTNVCLKRPLLKVFPIITGKGITHEEFNETDWDLLLSNEITYSLKCSNWFHYHLLQTNTFQELLKGPHLINLHNGLFTCKRN